MIKKILHYKRMIGESVALTKENHILLQRLLEKTNHLLEKTSHLLDETSRTEGFIHENAKDLGARISHSEAQLKLQHEIAAVNSETFSKYKNIHAGQDIAIIASGPSLNQYKQMEHVIHIGVNNVCKNAEIELDYYFVQDFGQKTSSQVPYKSDIVNLKCKKFFGLLAIVPNGLIEPSESFCANVNASRYFFEKSPSLLLHRDIRFHPLMDFCTVVFPVLHFALFTNPRRIYLVGVDTSLNNYYTNEKQEGSVAGGRHVLTHRMIGFRRVKEFVKTWYPETEIISINPVNLKGLFRDMYTDEHGNLIEETEKSPSTNECDFSDESIRLFLDNHIEQVLLKRVHDEIPCGECGGKAFSMLEGFINDGSENANQIKVKCDACGFLLLYPQH